MARNKPRLDQERQQRLEPSRMEGCKKKLEELGYKVSEFSKNGLRFEHNGSIITLWPYSGWFSGKGVEDGRGFHRLLKQLKQQ